MPSMHYSLAVESREQQINMDPRWMRQFGLFDEDNPVMIPVVSTDFIIQTPSQPAIDVSKQKVVTTTFSSYNDTTRGIPPLPPGRYKKHLSDPSRNNLHLASTSRSSTLSKSKSCGEGRSSEPSDALEVLSRKASTQRLGSGAPLIDKSTQESTGNYTDDSFEPPKASTADNFKCNPFCVYLPGFSSKKKPVQVRSQSHLSSYSVEGDNACKHNFYNPDIGTNSTTLASRPSVISKVASLERFNMSSVSSDIVIDCWDERHGSSYFDLPMELIDSCENETDTPVNAAFVFENERRGVRHRKKSSSSRLNSGKNSYEISSRRSNNNSRISGSGKLASDGSSMRSSRSSAGIVTKILEAREELNAFVEARSR